jgi:hypothetical protein
MGAGCQLHYIVQGGNKATGPCYTTHTFTCATKHTMGAATPPAHSPPPPMCGTHRQGQRPSLGSFVLQPNAIQGVVGGGHHKRLPNRVPLTPQGPWRQRNATTSRGSGFIPTSSSSSSEATGHVPTAAWPTRGPRWARRGSVDAAATAAAAPAPAATLDHHDSVVSRVKVRQYVPIVSPH